MKKLLIILSVFLSATTLSAQSKTALFGDFNNDGKITVSDITYMTNIFMGKTNSTLIIGEYHLDNYQGESSDIIFGDYNKDGQITAEDIEMLMNISLEEDKAPVLGYYFTEEFFGPKLATIQQFVDSAYTSETEILTYPSYKFNEILELLQMSKMEFLANYEPICYDDHKNVMKQFEITVNNNKVTRHKPIEWENTYTEINNNPDDFGATLPIISFELDKFDKSYIYGKTNHSDTIYVAYKKRGSSIITIFIPIQLSIIERNSIDYGYNNINYWTSKTKDNVTEMDESVIFNVNYPKDNENTYTFDLDEFKSEETNKEDIYGFVRNINDAWIGRTLKFSDTNAYIKEKQPIYYFHPQNKNVTIINDKDSCYYTLNVDNNYISSKVWNKGDGPILNTENDYNQIINDSVSKESPDFVKKAESAHLIDTQVGIYNNTKLYAIKEGEECSEKNCIAEINRYTGKLHYLYNDRAKAVLSASAQLSAYIGIFLPDLQNDNTAVPISYDVIPNNIFKINIYRPISVQPVQGTLNDVAMASYTSVFDKFLIIDWRNEKFIDYNSNNPYENVWLYAYYNINKITIDLDNIMIDFEGTKYPLKNLTRSLRFSYVESDKKTILACNDYSSGANTIGSKKINLYPYNNAMNGSETTYESLLDSFGYIKYENYGLNLINTSVSIPVIISYDWGEINTQMELNIRATLANE